MSLYFCSGLKRSGSTWSYNVCRLLLGHVYGVKNLIVGYVGEGKKVESFINQKAQAYTNTLIKFHYPTPAIVELVAQGKAINVYTIRDPLSALASEIDFFNRPFSMALINIEAGLIAMDSWKQKPGTLFVDFANIIARPKQEIERIVVHFELDIDDEFVSQCARETSFKKMKQQAENLKNAPQERLIRAQGLRYDPVTLLHVGHAPQGLSRDWKTILRGKELQIAIKRLNRWLPDEAHSKPQVKS